MGNTVRLSAATKRANAAVLRAFHDANEKAKEINAEVRRLRKEVEQIPDGQYYDMIKTYGNPRVIQDNDAVAKRYEALNEVVPTKLAHPLVVRRIASH